MSSLLLKITKQCNLLESDNLICDYDNTIIQTNKADSEFTYLKNFGYQPGIAFINDNVAFIENRNGKSDAQTLQDQTLENIVDSASFSLLVLRLLEKEVDKFYVRARRSANLGKAIATIEDWTAIELDGEIAFFPYLSFMPSDRYFIKDQYTTYFLNCTVIRWIDFFIRRNYKDNIVNLLNYCNSIQSMKSTTNGFS